MALLRLSAWLSSKSSCQLSTLHTQRRPYFFESTALCISVLFGGIELAQFAISAWCYIRTPLLSQTCLSSVVASNAGLCYCLLSRSVLGTWFSRMESYAGSCMLPFLEGGWSPDHNLTTWLSQLSADRSLVVHVGDNVEYCSWFCLSRCLLKVSPLDGMAQALQHATTLCRDAQVPSLAASDRIPPFSVSRLSTPLARLVILFPPLHTIASTGQSLL